MNHPMFAPTVRIVAMSRLAITVVVTGDNDICRSSEHNHIETCGCLRHPEPCLAGSIISLDNEVILPVSVIITRVPGKSPFWPHGTKFVGPPGEVRKNQVLGSPAAAPER
jgi:hypothetical protein